jgi:lysozyme
MCDFYTKIMARVALPGLLLALAACGAGPEVLPGKPLVGARPGHYKETEATELARNFTIHGVDVSKYQGNVDWMAVQEGGVQFAYIKATEGGDRIDPKFVQNWQGAKAAGLPHGAYHFVYWCRPWSENMAWFEKNVPPERDALPPVLDGTSRRRPIRRPVPNGWSASRRCRKSRPCWSRWSASTARSP